MVACSKLQMDNQETSHLPNGKFTWRIESFSKLTQEMLYSETFTLGGYPWRILMFPKGSEQEGYLSLYLDAADSQSLPAGWSRGACFSLAIINQMHWKNSVKKDAEHWFKSSESAWGFPLFVPLDKLCDPTRGYLKEDTCIINAEVSILKSEKENQVDKASDPTSLESGDQAGQMEVEIPQQDQKQGVKPSSSASVSMEPAEHTGTPSLPAGLSSNPMDELLDVRGLGKIESAFVPLLEEVCSKHPSLLECQRKRSGRFVGWAFTALGRVLHFLKTKRGKDMNNKTCKRLKKFWYELETFGFDLTWLEPHVQSALGMKNYVKKAMQVKKLRDNASALEMEMKRLKAKLAAAEIDLEIAKRDMVLAEEGFEERDLDAELGYGRP